MILAKGIETAHRIQIEDLEGRLNSREYDLIQNRRNRISSK